jgi:hypothetical protein
MDRTGLSQVRSRIDAAARAAGRSAAEIDLVVVSKYASDTAVQMAMADGATMFGESRVAGLERRAGTFPAVSWHFIGKVQRNKAARIRRVAAALHSMDRAALVPIWLGDGTAAPPVFVQVDLAGEPQKGGVEPSATAALVETCTTVGIDVVGLMTIPPRGERPEDSRRWFAALRDLRDAIQVDHPTVAGLSMGMTDDFEVAVAEGATVLRVGRAIFDPLEDNED